MPKVKTKQLVIEILRDGGDGHIYSQIRNKNAERDERHSVVVIDRASRRPLDEETVRNRAQYLSILLGIPAKEDLTWPCIAARGLRNCRCADCVMEEKKRG